MAAIANGGGEGRPAQKVTGLEPEAFVLLCPNVERELIDLWNYCNIDMAAIASAGRGDAARVQTVGHTRAQMATYAMESDGEPTR